MCPIINLSNYCRCRTRKQRCYPNNSLPRVRKLAYSLRSTISHFNFIFFRYAIDNGAPNDIEVAYLRGKNATGFSEKCFNNYQYCPYAARTMLKVLHIYSYIFGD